MYIFLSHSKNWYVPLFSSSSCFCSNSFRNWTASWSVRPLCQYASTIARKRKSQRKWRQMSWWEVWPPNRWWHPDSAGGAVVGCAIALWLCTTETKCWANLSLQSGEMEGLSINCLFFKCIKGQDGAGVCVCVHACVSEWERESVCVCVRVWVFCIVRVCAGVMEYQAIGCSSTLHNIALSECKFVAWQTVFVLLQTLNACFCSVAFQTRLWMHSSQFFVWNALIFCSAAFWTRCTVCQAPTQWRSFWRIPVPIFFLPSPDHLANWLSWGHHSQGRPLCVLCWLRNTVPR